MSMGMEKPLGQGAITRDAAVSTLRHEFQHLRSTWWCFALLGVLLLVCGTAAVVFPALTVVTSIVAVKVLGVLLMVAGVITIITSFWAGKWSGFLVNLMVGILYLAAGFVATDREFKAMLVITAFIAVSFIVIGLFRTLAALLIRFPQWGWALLNGVITLLAGIVIYRHLLDAALWVIGLLVGLEMLFNGWMWLMLSLEIRKIPKEVAG
jgi:uncharacterized membrane protein HdeD (DUF308 family)